MSDTEQKNEGTEEVYDDTKEIKEAPEPVEKQKEVVDPATIVDTTEKFETVRGADGEVKKIVKTVEVDVNELQTEKFNLESIIRDAQARIREINTILES